MDHNTPRIQLTALQPQAPHLSDSFLAARNRVPHLRDGSIVAKVGHRASDPLSFPRHTFLLIFAVFLTATLPIQAQWDIQDSRSTASLRGIHNVGGGVAWASGTDGTVLRTEDGGYLWQTCATPPGAEKLDFRGIQAFDENTAIVMSSGKGDLSRLYKTTDGCRTWKLLFTNPDKEGFWDTLVISNHNSEGLLIGDQVDGKFAMFAAMPSLDDWKRFDHTVRSPDLPVNASRSKNEVMFAASNSILAGDPGGGLAFVTGGKDGSFLHATKWHPRLLFNDWWSTTFAVVPIPMAKGDSAGTFSFATRDGCPNNSVCTFVVVGGDYMKPNEKTGTAAYGTVSHRSGVPDRFARSESSPGGYRSSVAYDPTTKTWITVGPNGTDISRDDGRNWTPLKPTPTEPQDADKNWNALSLPFVVGPKGRIGKLRDTAIPTAASSKEEKKE